MVLAASRLIPAAELADRDGALDGVLDGLLEGLLPSEESPEGENDSSTNALIARYRTQRGR